MPFQGRPHEHSLESATGRALRPASPAPASSLLQLQALAGNRAVAGILGRRPRRPPPRGAPVAQRLLSDGAWDAFVPQPWMDTPQDGRNETLRQILTNPGMATLKAELLANLGDAAGVAVGNITEVDPAGQVVKKLLDGGFTVAGGDKQARAATTRAIHAPLRTRLVDTSTMTVFDSPLSAAQINGAARQPIIHPNELVKAPSDLAADYAIGDICPLIAIYKSQLGNLHALNTAMGMRGNETDLQYYAALHRYYFTDRHIEYTEPATHPSLFRQWGFSMILSGPVTYAQLPAALGAQGVTLQSGRNYILTIDGHTVLVTMRRTVSAASEFPTEASVTQAFEFKSDQRNFNQREERRRILYIWSQ